MSILGTNRGLCAAVIGLVNLVGCSFGANDRSVIGSPSAPTTPPSVSAPGGNSSSAQSLPAGRRIGTLQFRDMRLEISSGYDRSGPRFAVSTKDHSLAHGLSEDDLAMAFPELHTVYRTARAGTATLDARIAPELAERARTR